MAPFRFHAEHPAARVVASGLTTRCTSPSARMATSVLLHGWLIGYDGIRPDAAGWRIHDHAEWQRRPLSWQSGRGPAADRQGNIYAVTGNGDYDGMRNFESFVKISLQGSATVDLYTPADWKSMSDNDFDLSAGPH